MKVNNMSEQTTKTINVDSDKYQNVYITLKDGSVGLFTGPAMILDPNDVKAVNFSQVKDLPEGMTWEDLWK